jgi:hypothetical protein
MSSDWETMDNRLFLAYNFHRQVNTSLRMGRQQNIIDVKDEQRFNRAKHLVVIPI